MADGDSEEQLEKALKSFYKIAASSCATLLDTIADACEISALSSSTSVNNPDNRGTRLSINGQVTMAVKLKPSRGPQNSLAPSQFMISAKANGSVRNGGDNPPRN